MGYPFDDSFDIYGLSAQNRLDRLKRNPYDSLLATPGLMDQSPPPMGGMFQPNYNQPQSYNPPQQLDDGEESIEESIRKIMEMNDKYYHPEHSASDRLNQLIGNFPKDERPSLGRTILAAGAGFTGGIKGSQEVLDEPRKKKIEDWKTQTQPAYEAATIERQSNANERALLGNMITAETNSRKNRATEKIAQRKNDIQQEKNQATAEHQRTWDAIRDFKAHHPDWKFDTSGARVIATNPAGPEMYTLGPTSHLSDAQLADVKGNWNLKAAEARGMNAEDLENARQVNRMLMESMRAGNAVNLKQTPGAAPEENETQQRVGQANRARQLMNTDPIYSKMIKFTGPGANDFTITAPSRGLFSGVSAEEQKKYDEAVKIIYSPQVQKTQPIAGSGTIPKQSQQQQSIQPQQTEGIVKRNPSNPMMQIKTLPNGRVQYSQDGGKTWSDTKPGQPSIGSSISGGNYNAPTD